MIRIVCFLFLLAAARADITGTNPAAGQCICFNAGSVNIRNGPCSSTVIGTGSVGQCYKSTGTWQSCTLSGTVYEFHEFEYGSGTGWAAGIYLDSASDASCGGSSGSSYVCDVPSSDLGKRIHETTSATPYDCLDNSCGNSCQGGQCVALVTCRCKRNGQWAPNTSCWTPGVKVINGGTCNTAIAANTAIATFDSSSNYYGHAAIFLRCSGANIVVRDQWCCGSIAERTYTSSSSYYTQFSVIENGGCADRASWPCRLENAGATCCPTSVPGCLKSRVWWSNDSK